MPTFIKRSGTLAWKILLSLIGNLSFLGFCKKSPLYPSFFMSLHLKLTIIVWNNIEFPLCRTGQNSIFINWLVFFLDEHAQILNILIEFAPSYTLLMINALNMEEVIFVLYSTDSTKLMLALGFWDELY